jgi:iron complex outermembrane recepter protein
MRNIAFLLLWSLPWTGYGQITGSVQDSKGEPLTGVSVFNAAHAVGDVTDHRGYFKVMDWPAHGAELTLSYLGFETLRIWIEPSSNPRDLGILVLKERSIELSTLTILDEFAKNEGSLSGIRLSGDFFENNQQGSFAKSLERLPGIASINVGVGVAKPVIRGLSSNRIIVNYLGIKQESQQWGNDHGLEIDPYDVEKVEIVKGPATLQYGSDGLGGVINIKPGAVPTLNTWSASIMGIGKSNNLHGGATAKLALNKNNFFFSGRFTYQSFGDYGVPADRFEYNGFSLPIFDNRLKNTAGREENKSIVLGYLGKHSVSRFTMGRFSQVAGLFFGAVGIPRAYSLQPDGDPRNIQTPRQEVDHTRLTFHQSFALGEDHFVLNLGFQRNDRREYSIPDFHNIPATQLDFNNQLALGLVLDTYTANAHYERKWESTKANLGLDFQWQDNRREGFAFFLPDFRTIRSGIFGLMEKNVSDNWTVMGGLRLDYGNNHTDFYRQFIWDSNENIIDSLLSVPTQAHFFNISASLGFNYSWASTHRIKLNMARSFRIPHPSETSSNGIHHGTFRHEQGQTGLVSETGWQFDLNWKQDHSVGSWEVSTYCNVFKDYIFLGPTFPARFSTLPEAGQLFRYRQEDALYTGVEFEGQWNITNQWTWHFIFDFVQSFNRKTQMALPFTPQPALKNMIAFHLVEWGGVSNFNAEIEHQFHFAAIGPYRVDRSERETPATQLWHLALSLETRFFQQPLKVHFQALNILDTYYLNHLSRYRWINVPEQGRNLVLGLKWNFGGKL